MPAISANLHLLAGEAMLKPVWCAPPARIQAAAPVFEIGLRNPDDASHRQLGNGASGGPHRPR